MNFVAKLSKKNRGPKFLYFLELLGHSNLGSAVVEFFSFLGRSGIYRPEQSKAQICIFFVFMIGENRAKPLYFLAFLGQRYWIVDILAFLVTAFPYPTFIILTHFKAAAVKSLDI